MNDTAGHTVDQAAGHAPDIDVARAVADAVLFEGYVLYPYYASADKNRLRWQFGVLVPPEADSTEPDVARTECLVDPRGEDPTLDVMVRFLHVQDRYSPAEGGESTSPWQEGTVEEIALTVPVHAGEVREMPLEVPGGEETADGVTRRRQPLTGMTRVHAERLSGPYGTLRVRIEVVNTTPAPGSDDAAREDMLRHSLVSAHTLLTVHDGKFLSLLDPPEWAKPAAEACQNLHTYPVLVGEGPDDVMLSSPIILYDHPTIAPESTGDLCDATEIDEILTLRTMALTDEEKDEARATDTRAAEIIDRVDSMPQEMLERLHGTVRYLQNVTGEGHGSSGAEVDATEPGAAPWWDPGADASVSPDTDMLPLAGGMAGKGSRVRLHPAPTGTDVQDMFLAGRTATVSAVFFDVEDSGYLAVTLDDDPAADLLQQHGRYLYFTPDEVELLRPDNNGSAS